MEKVVVAIVALTLAYIVVFVCAKPLVGKRFAHLAAQLSGGLAALSTMFLLFVVFP
ncbi:hypothetical protein LA345_40490 (plasmid) [Burkholderia vietnamiensis]|nr:hypothetical protein [Burkholderia vietnamiensis]